MTLPHSSADMDSGSYPVRPTAVDLDGTRPDEFPRGMISRLLSSSLMTPPTRAVFEERIRTADAPDAAALATLGEPFCRTLRAFCETALNATAGDEAAVNYVVREISSRLACGATNGWRFDGLPPDRAGI